MNSDIYGENTRVNPYAFIVASVLTPFISLFILKTTRKRVFSDFILMSILFNILTSRVYIFYRFTNYILLPLAVAYAEVIHAFSSRFVVGKRKNIFVIPVLLFLFVI